MAARPRAEVFDLARCLALAEQHYPKLREAQARVDMAETQVTEAHSIPYRGFTAKGGMGLAPTVEGTSIYSPNSQLDFNNLELTWRVGADGLVPLYTFGKIVGAWEAAEAGVRVSQAALVKDRNELRVNVIQAYFGVQFARDSLLLIDDARQRMRKYMDKLQKRVDADESEEVPLLDLEVQLIDLDNMTSTAMQQGTVAEAWLRFLVGAPRLEVPDEPLEAFGYELEPLDTYVGEAVDSRPDILMARAGVAARRALAGIEEARLYPDIGLALGAEVSAAPAVADQQNPFVSDMNYVRYGFALVAQWSLDVVGGLARAHRAEAQAAETQAQLDFAMGAVPVDVQRMYEDALHALRRLEVFTRGVSVAKRWVIQVQQAIDVGTMEESEIARSAREYAMKRFYRLQALYDYNVALSKLFQATGVWRLPETTSEVPAMPQGGALFGGPTGAAAAGGE